MLTATANESGKDVCQHYSWTGGPLADGVVPPRAPGPDWQANTEQEPHTTKQYTWIAGQPGLHYRSNESNGKADWFDCVALPKPPEPTPSQTTPAGPTPPATQTPTPTPSQTTPAAPTPPASQTPTPPASSTPTPTAPVPTVGTPTPTATPKASTSPTPKADRPRPKAPRTATPTPKAPTIPKPKAPVTPLPKCSDVAKQQANADYAKDSPQANGTPCKP